MKFQAQSVKAGQINRWTAAETRLTSNHEPVWAPKLQPSTLLGSTRAFENMGIIFVSLFYTLLPLLVCIVGLTIAFHRSRSRPILQAATNFKRPHWLVVFFSLAIIAVGVFVVLLGLLWCFLDDHYIHSHQKLGPNFIFTVLGLAIAGVGALCLWFSSIFCLWRLLSALFTHVHSVQSKRAV